MATLGQKVKSEDFNLIFKKADCNLKTKIVISRKVASKAVDRNRIKRLFREVLRANKGENKELVIIVKRNLSSFKRQDIQSKMEEMFAKIK